MNNLKGMRQNMIVTFDQAINKVFNELFDTPVKYFPGTNSGYPKCDVIKTNTGVTFVFEIPGIKKEDIKLKILEDTLEISGAKKESNSDFNIGTDEYIIRELKRTSFSRSFKLDNSLDTTKIEASFLDSILTLTIPFKKEIIDSKQERTISIK